MKYLIVAPEIAPLQIGGIGAHNRALATGLAALGVDVEMIGYRLHEAPMFEHSWGRSYSVALHPRLENWWRLGRVDPHRVIRGTLALAFATRRNRIDCDFMELHNWPGSAAFARIPSSGTLARVSSPYLDAQPRASRGYIRLVTKLEATTCRRARFVATHSLRMRERARDLYGLRNVNVIPLGLEDLSVPEPLVDSTIDILFIGRCEWRKGVDAAIGGALRAATKHAALRFHWCGRGFRAALESHCWAGIQVRDEALSENRHFFYEDVSDADKLHLLSLADALLMPSRFESFGLVALEALRQGVPLVVTRVGALGELADLHDSGLVLAELSEESVDKALDEVAKRGPGYRSAVAEELREVFRSRYTADRVARTTLGLLGGH
jgi:hypothetical protein